MRGQRLQGFRCHVLDDVQHEVSTHAGAQDLGCPAGGRTGGGEQRLHTGSSGRAQDGADVAGVLHAVEHDDVTAFPEARWQRPLGDIDHGQYRGR